MFIFVSKQHVSLWPRLLAPTLPGVLAAALSQTQAQAAPVSTYVVPDQEGYGIVECLTQKSDCGRIVADAWCESHGHRAARAYGPVEDLTAAIPASERHPPAPAGATIISCDD